MTKMLGSVAAGAFLLALALPGSANAADSKRTDGLTNPTPQATEFSSRHRRWHRRYVVRRYYSYPRYYGDYYAYAPYPYYRPYYRRYYGPGVYFGGPGFSFGFGY